MDGELSIIFVTGYHSMQDCIDAFYLRIYEILMKSIDSTELLRVTRKALSSRRS